MSWSMLQLSDIVEKSTMLMLVNNPDDVKSQDTAFSAGYQQGVLINNLQLFHMSI